jgi:hypothetical protein
MAAPLTWDDGRENLQLFATSLYLEDVFTHSHYNCPANRFYEALFCDTVVLSQPEATNTWQRAGINLGVDRIVAGADDYVDLSNRILSDAALRGRYLDEQRGWAHDAVIQRAQLLADIRQLFVSVL